MTDNVENLILEHLRALRGGQDRLEAEIREVKMRLTSIEERSTLVEKGIANVHGDLAILQLRMDRQGDRLDRIEKRLELTAA